VTFEEFLKGVMRLKGQARAMDVVAILHSATMTQESIKYVLDRVDEIDAQVDSLRTRSLDLKRVKKQVEDIHAWACRQPPAVEVSSNRHAVEDGLPGKSASVEDLRGLPPGESWYQEL